MVAGSGQVLEAAWSLLLLMIFGDDDVADSNFGRPAQRTTGWGKPEAPRGIPKGGGRLAGRMPANPGVGEGVEDVGGDTRGGHGRGDKRAPGGRQVTVMMLYISRSIERALKRQLPDRVVGEPSSSWRGPLQTLSRQRARAVYRRRVIPPPHLRRSHVHGVAREGGGARVTARLPSPLAALHASLSAPQPSAPPKRRS